MCLDHVGHPFFEAVGGEAGDMWWFAVMVLHEVVFASEVAVDFGYYTVVEAEDGVPGVSLVFELGLFVESSHLGG